MTKCLLADWYMSATTGGKVTQEYTETP